jgi:hypothetical protein
LLISKGIRAFPFSPICGIFSGRGVFVAANREYKSSVFSLLFGEETTLRGLYEALEGVALPPDVPIAINTLEDALFKTKRTRP